MSNLRVGGLACNGCVSGTGEGNGCKTCEWGTNFQELL